MDRSLVQLKIELGLNRFSVGMTVKLRLNA